MTINLSLFAGAGWQFFTNDGTPLNGGKLYTYAAGSTTPLATYTDSTGNTQNDNPIVLTSAGRVPYEIWLTSGLLYKFILTTSSGATIANCTWDNIPGVSDVGAALANSSSVTQGDALVAFKQSNYAGAYTGAVASSVHQKLQDVVSIFDVMTAAQIADAQSRTAAIDSSSLVQLVLNTGRSLYLPYGKFKWTVMPKVKNDGQMIFGEGRYGETVIVWEGSGTTGVLGNDGTTRRQNIVFRDFRIEFNLDDAIGIDFSQFSYSTIDRVDIQGYGNNTVGVKIKGAGTTGDRPYYNVFNQVDVASNNISGGTSGSIGWYLERDVSPTPSNFNGPNGNMWIGGRVSGADKAFVCEDADGNTWIGCNTESIKVNHFEFGVPDPYYPSSGGAAVFAATVNTITDNSGLVCDANEFVNGVIYIVSGPGMGQYRQILNNGANGNPFTIYPYWDEKPDNTSTYQIFPESGGGNTIIGCRGEGDSLSSPTYLKIHPGAISTYIQGGEQSSVATIIDDVAPRIANRFNPGGWRDPQPITFALLNVAASLTNEPLFPVGWLRNNFSPPGNWHIAYADVACNGAITSGTGQLWVTSNGAKLTTDANITLTSTSTFDTQGGSVTQRLFNVNELFNNSINSQLGMVLTTDGGFLPNGTVDLYVTLWVVQRG